MFRLSVLAVLLLAATCAIGQESVKIGPEPHNITTAPPPPITTTTTTTTTPKPNTTTSITTTTAKTTTTTSTPKTTTTTSTPKTTTTSATTTTAVPPTTPKPTPVPVPTPGLWAANYTGTNRTCLVVRAAIQIEIPAGVNKTVKVNLPENATAMGDCSKSYEAVKLTWPGGNAIVLNFTKTNTSKFELELFEADLNVTMPGANATVLRYQHVKPEFATPLDNSYRCNKEQTFNITAMANPKDVAYLYLSDLQFQAFRNVTGHKFDSAIDCESGTQRDVIPIVVGCVLAALVVLVLAGYLFGRRRCQARGYLSM